MKIVVTKNNNYTVMSNYHLKEKQMSLKAKGLLSLMLSLPDTWNYTVEGLSSICAESVGTIKSILKELQLFGYLVIIKKYPDETTSGRFEYVYNIYELPEKQSINDTAESDNDDEKTRYKKQPLESCTYNNIINNVNSINPINTNNNYINNKNILAKANIADNISASPKNNIQLKSSKQNLSEIKKSASTKNKIKYIVENHRVIDQQFINLFTNWLDIMYDKGFRPSNVQLDFIIKQLKDYEKTIGYDKTIEIMQATIRTGYKDFSYFAPKSKNNINNEYQNFNPNSRYSKEEREERMRNVEFSDKDY